MFTSVQFIAENVDKLEVDASCVATWESIIHSAINAELPIISDFIILFFVHSSVIIVFRGVGE